MKVSAIVPTEYTLTELMQKLRDLGLTGTGNKAELISLLSEADPSGSWMMELQNLRGIPRRDVEVAAQEDSRAEKKMAMYRRENELYRKKKELAEREIEFLKREVEQLSDVSARP